MFLFFVFFIFFNLTFSNCEIYKVYVNSSATSTTKLTRFWSSTGFCPPLPHQEDSAFFLGADMQQNLLYISSAPQNAVRQVRMHWLLDMLTVNQFVNGTPQYNFTNLDNLVTFLWENDFTIGFEVMGNPSNMFTDFENKTQVYWWKDLVSTLAQRYVDSYGLYYISQWNFETWNEPDTHDFDGLNFTVQGFLNYFDATRQGLLEVSTLLRLGGPGDKCSLSGMYCWPLLRHCVNGTNYFTGEKGVRIDFISLHKKGSGSSSTIMNDTLDTVNQIHLLLPDLKNVPIYNDEADPLVGWSKDESWRADAIYAAIVAKVITQHQTYVIPRSDINFQLLSNDNGFLSYNPSFFTQRTLLARFQMNNTSPPHVHFVRKPVLGTMALLALVGDQQLPMSVSEDGRVLDSLGVFGGFTTVHLPEENDGPDSWQLSVLLYLSNDTTVPSSQSASIQLTLDALKPPTQDVMYTVYRINNVDTNPFLMWQKAGSPKTPKVADFAFMRSAEGPLRSTGPSKWPAQSPWSLQLSMTLPEVLFFHLCARPSSPPDQTNNVLVTNITSNQVLVTWSDACVHSKCLTSFEVEYSSTSASGPYQRINPVDTIFTSFVFSPAKDITPNDDTLVTGFYRVRAVDYWDNAGAYSLPASYPDNESAVKSRHVNCRSRA